MAVFIDQDVIGVDVTDLFVPKLKLIACTNQVVEYVPNLCLVEVFAEVVAILYLTAENKLEFVVCDLCYDDGIPLLRRYCHKIPPSQIRAFKALKTITDLLRHLSSCIAKPIANSGIFKEFVL